MLIAIISDVHANLEAVETCFGRIDEIKPDKIICLGDMVDYCAQPNEVTEIIRSRCENVLLGNHDEGQFRYELADGFSQNAYISSVHTRSVIKDEYKEYFRSLPYSFSSEELLFVHASPSKPEKYKYVITEDDAKTNFDTFREKICFIGHSHKPVIFELNKDNIKLVSHGRLKRENRYIINVGSVGQPRDGDPRLSFGIFDTDKFEFKLERLQYDIDGAANKIIAEGLPFYLAERLFTGI